MTSWSTVFVSPTSASTLWCQQARSPSLSLKLQALGLDQKTKATHQLQHFDTTTSQVLLPVARAAHFQDLMGQVGAQAAADICSILIYRVPPLQLQLASCTSEPRLLLAGLYANPARCAESSTTLP